MTSIPKLLKLKDYITLTGTTLGILALICAVIGSRFFISWGFFLITISLGTDLLDGYIARKTGTVNKFGIELDSLSDSLTFGIAPAVLIYQAFLSFLRFRWQFLYLLVLSVLNLQYSFLLFSFF